MASDELDRFREQWRQEIRERTQAQPQQSTPIDIYAEAVEREQRGELDGALELYRRAFRLDPNVDRAYHYKNTTNALYTLTIASKPQPKPEPLHVAATSTHSIHTLISAFPPAEELKFAPEDERQPVHLVKIPDELLLHILKILDVSSIERFAMVCRRARVLTLDPDLWRDFVVSTYRPPQVPAAVSLEDIIAPFGRDLRRLYIELPRVRLDGVYIAVCHLADVRPGQSENAWVNVGHLVTYHRYLRFLPDGRALSLLDQTLEPREAVHLMTPDLQLKGFFIGTWTLHTSNNAPPRVFIDELTDPCGKFEHSFKMKLTLGSKPLGSRGNVTEIWTRNPLLFHRFLAFRHCFQYRISDLSGIGITSLAEAGPY
ncbi:F-box protein pof7 [Ceratobasidium theobromae]|uniref:F-box protein pof7 n=1 Tax=Ceratobasidium theobromae TaxID=1582974 RepID=A0A5N5QS64_9AGAM|nr:F-box protein pof7 [Ceratobasidium theobromae]